MTEERITMQFRDGVRDVAPHVKAMLTDAQIPTHRYTYEQAIRMADEQRLGDAVFQAQSALIDQHFKDTL